MGLRAPLEIALESGYTRHVRPHVALRCFLVAYTARVQSLRSAIGDQISVALLRRVRVPIGDLVMFPTPVKSSQLASVPFPPAPPGLEGACRAVGYVGRPERIEAVDLPPRAGGQ